MPSAHHVSDQLPTAYHSNLSLENLRANTMSSRDFNQDIAKATRAALHAPVFVTDRGKPAHVLMSMPHFEELQAQIQAKTQSPKTMAELLYMPGIEDIEFETVRNQSPHRPVDLG
jgi:PHD/YefM family antitoxin component YafN of YafNO toxin-antitoxin module